MSLVNIVIDFSMCLVNIVIYYSMGVDMFLKERG